MKSNKDVIQELVDIIADVVSQHSGAQAIMLKPALNVVKMKMSNMSEKDSADIIDKVHLISHRIELMTGELSPYHNINSDVKENLQLNP